LEVDWVLMQDVTCAARLVTSVAADATSVRARRRRGSAEGWHVDVGVALPHVARPDCVQSRARCGVDVVPDGWCRIMVS
jgi:hypothetical protein